ncbi:hypothetical protein AVEN_231334-1 [Araneus ventricosus]|uniref:Uncharacterized protein n=1 Tax=Araneus ventricosus TaxID=182803 RepID=A0A4Y2CHN3_ARAVE|nr:hypothetical protein AVEN_231334-1 [Araneus ventricosus]
MELGYLLLPSKYLSCATMHFLSSFAQICKCELQSSFCHHQCLRRWIALESLSLRIFHSREKSHGPISGNKLFMEVSDCDILTGNLIADRLVNRRPIKLEDP